MGARLRALTARRTDHLAAHLGDEKPALGTPPPSLRSLPRWRSNPNCRPRNAPNQVMTHVPPIPRPPRRASRPILSHVTELYLTGSYVYAGGLPGGGIIASADSQVVERRESSLHRRETAGSHRAPPARGHPDQALALVEHGAAIVLPIRVFTGDHVVIVDEQFHSFGHVDHLRISVELHIGTAEFVREHAHAGPRVASDVDTLGAPRIARDYYPALPVDPAGHRRTLQRRICAKGGQNHLVPRPDEIQ